jgi:GT2 family glycosyltransferase
MYYEDVDLCARFKLAGLRLAVFPEVRAIHDARRASRASLRHLRWHLASMLRFFLSAPAARNE